MGSEGDIETKRTRFSFVLFGPEREGPYMAWWGKVTRNKILKIRIIIIFKAILKIFLFCFSAISSGNIFNGAGFEFSSDLNNYFLNSNFFAKIKIFFNKLKRKNNKGDNNLNQNNNKNNRSTGA